MRKKKKKKSDFDRLVQDISSTMKKFEPILKMAKASGVFLEDRDLLECKNCGLQEDVTHEGILIVVRKRQWRKDTGLRFKETKKNSGLFRCPSCKKTIKAKF